MGLFTYMGTAVLIERGMNALEPAVAEGLEDLTGKSMEETPVDTGTLRASEHVEGPTRSGMTIEGRVTTGGEASDYAIYVHGGTYKMAARPFLSTALQQNRAIYVEAIARAGRGAY